MPRPPPRLVFLFLFSLISFSSSSASRCRVPGISLVWKRETGIGQLTLAPPYLATAAPAHFVSLIDVHTAKSLPGWPFSLPTAAFSSAPLILDYDGDGEEEVLMFTADGVILGVAMNGIAKAEQTLRLGGLEVPRLWYQGLDSPDVRASLSLVQRPVLPLPAIPPSRAALTANMPASMNFTGVEKWLPQEGVESLSLFLRHSHAVLPHAKGTQGEAAMDDAIVAPRLLHSHLKKDHGSVIIPPHILTTPVATNLGDGRTTLLIPVSYFIDRDVPGEMEVLAADGIDATKYVAGGLVAVSRGAVVWHREFDVTIQAPQGVEEMRAFMATRPVPVDMDRDGKSEIIVSTDSGRVYVLNWKGEPIKWGAFPLEHTAVLATPVADDLQGDGEVEIIVMAVRDEDSGRVHCYDRLGKEVWAVDFEGVALAEPLLVHLDRDGVLDVAWGTTAGMVYAVRGDTGEALANFPVSLGRAAEINTPLRVITYGLSRALVAACTDGYLAFIALPTACIDRVDLAQPLTSAFYLGDFSQRGGLELLVPSSAGQAYLVATDAVFHPLQAWHDRAKGPGVHHAAGSWLGAYFATVSIGGERLMVQEISGTDIAIKIDIVDERKQTLQGRSYAVRVQLDSKVLLDRTYSSPGRYEESVALDEGTARGAHMLTLRMRNELGQECGDAMYVTVEPRTERVVRWLVLLPLVALFLLLMLVREAPDLLPQ